MDLISLLGGLAQDIVGRIFPNPEDKLKAQELQNELSKAFLEQYSAIQTAAAANVKQEAASSFWLAANWRPIAMITFLILIVARMFGLTAANISPEEYNHLWNLMEVGLGGYVMGRSVEKMAPFVAQAMSQK